MKKIKIALLSNSFPPEICGIGDYTFFLFKSLTKNNQDVSVIFPHKDNNLKKVEYESLPFELKSWSIRNIYRTINILKKQNYDVIHIQNTNIKKISYYLIPILARILSRLCVVVTIHEHSHKSLIGKLANIISIVAAHHIIVCEQAYKRSLSFFMSSKRITFLPVPPNIPKSQLSESDALLLKHNYAKGKLLIGYFGFLVEHKGVKEIFKVCNPTEHFVLLISNFEKFRSKYSEEIKEIIESQEWRDSAYCTGFLPAEQVADLLYASDICIFPFKNGSGDRNASLSAARLQGTYCIVSHMTKRGYFQEENCYYTAPEDIEAMRKGILFYKEYTNKKSNKPTVNDWEYITAEHIKIYNFLLCK